MPGGPVAWSLAMLLLVLPPSLFREGLVLLLAQQARWGEVRLADTAQAALRLAPQTPRPAALVVDLALPDLQLPQAPGVLADAFPAVPWLGLTDDTGALTVARAFRAGAALCMLRSAGFEALQAALVLLCDREHCLLPSQSQSRAGLAGVIVPPAPVLPPASRKTPRANSPALAALTPKQREVMQLLLEGKSGKIIARELNLSPGTVKSHTTAVLRALNVNTRLEAAVAARRLGLTDGTDRGTA